MSPVHLVWGRVFGFCISRLPFGGDQLLRYLLYQSNLSKLLEENIRQTLSDINNSNIFSDPPLRVTTIKTKINKWDLIKLKSFCTAKETLNKTKRQPTEWDKIFASESTDKGLISKIYKHLLQPHTKKTNNPIKKWVEDLNRQFSKEDIQMAKK
uniref:Uncharacterized protein n=1 Tax=Sus scrofa TaxID=9823 RepID=A0A8D1FHW6_PIG